MKKTLFAIVIVSIFAVNGLVLAKNTPHTDSPEEIWAAIDDLNGQVATLQSNLLETRKSQEFSEKTIVNDNPKKTTKGKTIKEDKNSDISRSEHYIMKDFAIR